MGKLISSFTFDRNAVKADEQSSAAAVLDAIRALGNDVPPTKVQSNILGALASYTGVLERVDGTFRLTDLGKRFAILSGENVVDAWRWLLARSLWRYVVPNGTNAAVNGVSNEQRIRFAFFRTLLDLLLLLDSELGVKRFLFYEELCWLFSEDANWTRDSFELYSDLRSYRLTNFERVASTNRRFLDDLEPELGIPRDNFNGLINKTFKQTGFFEYLGGKSAYAIGLRVDLDPILRRRIRAIIDNEMPWDAAHETWSAYLVRDDLDLPTQLTAIAVTGEAVEEPVQSDLKGFLRSIEDSLARANLRFPAGLIKRFASCLLTKPLVILTGLSGSGKTRLAQSFAEWIAPERVSTGTAFQAGDVVRADKINYYVATADNTSVEFRNSQDADATRVTLPLALIREWADVIRDRGFDRRTSPRQIREEVSQSTAFSTQLNSFETHLKAAAFHVLESQRQASIRTIQVVPVGADWTSRDFVLGYPDALNDSRYFKTPILSLILSAVANPMTPYFLILDEMNLSHVERYFGDLLSAMESGEEIPLHGGGAEIETRDGIPPYVRIPRNLFIIGTVNVDETTYLFSPKVLDRANVIEFRVSEDGMRDFVREPQPITLDLITGKGAPFSRAFVAAAANSNIELPQTIRKSFEKEMVLLFRILREHHFEFGYRTAVECARFLEKFSVLGEHSSDTDDWFESAMDALLIQRILPKVHGARATVEGLLWALAWMCGAVRTNDFESDLFASSRMDDESTFGPEAIWQQLAKINQGEPWRAARYPLALEKVWRMWQRLVRDQFVTFTDS